MGAGAASGWDGQESRATQSTRSFVHQRWPGTTGSVSLPSGAGLTSVPESPRASAPLLPSGTRHGTGDTALPSRTLTLGIPGVRPLPWRIPEGSLSSPTSRTSACDCLQGYSSTLPGSQSVCLRCSRSPPLERPRALLSLPSPALTSRTALRGGGEGEARILASAHPELPLGHSRGCGQEPTPIGFWGRLQWRRGKGS